MKTVYFLLALSVSPTLLRGQSPKVPLKAESFQKAMNQYITKIMLDGNAVPGNYGSFDVKDAKLTGNFHRATFKTPKEKNKNLSNISGIWLVNVSAAATEGVATLLSKNNVSANLSAEIKYNIFFEPKGRYFESDEKDYQDQQAAVERWGDATKANYKAQKAFQDRLRNSLKVKRDALVKAILKNPPNKIELEKDLAQTELDDATAQGKLLTDFNQSIADYNKSIDKQVIEKKNGIEHKLSQTHINWFALRYKINNRSFYRFDSTAAYNSQKQTNNNNQEFGVEFNHISISVLKNVFSFFITTGVAYGLLDNFTSLTPLDVMDSHTYGGSAPSAALNRSAQVKYTSYQGNYVSGIQQWRFYTDFYWFVPPKIISAIHLAPEFQANDKITNVFNLSTGFVFSLMNKDDKAPKSNFNVELYVLLKDITNNGTYTGPSNAFTRGQSGLKLSFPINLNLLNTKN